ncbi:hypothetical protein AB0I89_02770 [Micromonospora sp. NPDC049801]|uniref:hypothetical protein n=1 Tax=unclassified Micromonospora TaxID=2617518 RepID=UPI0033E6352D
MPGTPSSRGARTPRDIGAGVTVRALDLAAAADVDEITALLRDLEPDVVINSAGRQVKAQRRAVARRARGGTSWA